MLLSLHKAAKLRGYPYPALLQAAKEERVRLVIVAGRTHPLIDLADLDAFIEASKSGSNGGSLIEITSEKTQENVATFRKSRKRDDVAGHEDKYQWMQDYAPRRQQA